MEQYISGGNLAPPQWIQSKLLQKKQCTLYEQRKLADALMYFTRLSIDELRQHLLNKPIDSYIDSIPYSLLLLETIYSKFYLYDKHEFPSNILKPERLLRQLIVYFTKEIDQKQQKLNAVSALDWKTVEPRAKNLLRTICDCCPKILNAFKSEKHRLDSALEGLGLHGLVNFGDRTLIEVTEAVKQELSDHQHRVKAFLQKVEKAGQKLPKEQSHCLYSINGFRGPVPSKSSHQRLMNLRLSDVKCRLQRNEHLLQLIKSSLTNADLENLARILQKRIFYDQTLLMELNFLLKSNTIGSLSHSFNDDPIASQVLVVFCKGYEKLLTLLPSIKADDSGLGDEDDNCVVSDTTTTATSTKPSDDVSSNGTTNRQQQIEIISQDSSNPYAKFSIKSDSDTSSVRKRSLSNSKKSADYLSGRNSNSLNKIPSLTNIYQIYQKPCQDLYLSKSTQHLASFNKSTCWSFDSLDVHEMQSKDKFNRFNYKTTPNRPADDDSVTKNELNRCKIEIERLRRQLENSNLKLQQQQQEGSKIYAPQMNFKESKNENNGSQMELIECYNVLFSDDRMEALEELNKMSEFQNSEELQLKILLSVIVLSFRSVQTDLSRSIDDVWKVLKEKTPLENLSNAEVELQKSVVQFLLYKSRQEFYSRTIKDVSGQIWQTLFDYPLLKTCKKFNGFIKSCVKVAWELSCGKPRFNIEFEANEFDATRHKRYRTSNMKNKTIRRFVWPALVEISTQNCVYRAIVIT